MLVLIIKDWRAPHPADHREPRTTVLKGLYEIDIARHNALGSTLTS